MRIDLGSVNNHEMLRLPGDFFPRLDSFMLRSGRDNDIFTVFEVNNSILVKMTPVENLFLGLFLFNQSFFSMAENVAARPMIGSEDPKHAFKRIQATIGYDIPNIGLFRLQYRGANPDVNEDTHVITAPRLEAAFAYTGTTNLIVDLGVKMFFLLDDPQIPARRNSLGQGITPIPALPSALNGANSLTGTKKLLGIYQAPQQASIGVQYRLVNLGTGNLTLRCRIDSKFLGWYQEHNRNIVRMGPEIKFSLWPSYRVEDWTFQAETTFIYGGDWTAYGRTMYRGGLGYGFGAFIQRHIGNSSSIAVGVAYSGGEGLVLPKQGAGLNPASINTHDNVTRVSSPELPGVLPSVFSIPVRFLVSY
jgi:hypothetical protein